MDIHSMRLNSELNSSKNDTNFSDYTCFIVLKTIRLAAVENKKHTISKHVNKNKQINKCNQLLSLINQK